MYCLQFDEERHLLCRLKHHTCVGEVNWVVDVQVERHWLIYNCFFRMSKMPLGWVWFTSSSIHVYQLEWLWVGAVLCRFLLWTNDRYEHPEILPHLIQRGERRKCDHPVRWPWIPGIQLGRHQTRTSRDWKLCPNNWVRWEMCSPVLKLAMRMLSR